MALLPPAASEPAGNGAGHTGRRLAWELVLLLYLAVSAGGGYAYANPPNSGAGLLHGALAVTPADSSGAT